MQHCREVELPGKRVIDHFQEIGAPYQLFHRLVAEFCHDSAHIFCKECKVVDDLIYRTGKELFAESLILCRDTDRTLIQVTDTQHFTADDAEYPGTESIGLGAQKCRFYNVQS